MFSLKKKRKKEKEIYFINNMGNKVFDRNLAFNCKTACKVMIFSSRVTPITL